MHSAKSQIVWAFVQFDQSVLSAWRNFASLAIQNAHSDDSDQTVHADLNLRRARMSEGTFSDFVPQMILITKTKRSYDVYAYEAWRAYTVCSEYPSGSLSIDTDQRLLQTRNLMRRLRLIWVFAGSNMQ